MHLALFAALKSSSLLESAEALHALSAGAAVEQLGTPFEIESDFERIYATRAKMMETREDVECKRLLAAVDEFVANMREHMGSQVQWTRIGEPKTWNFLCCMVVPEGKALGCMRVRHTVHGAADSGMSAA